MALVSSSALLRSGSEPASLRHLAWSVASLIAGTALAVAAVLKLHAIRYHSPLFDSEQANLAIVLAETWLAAWLFSQWNAPLARLLAIGCFLLFAFVSIAKGFAGLNSCGCFGSFRTNPWIVFVGDALILGLLLYSLPRAPITIRRFASVRVVLSAIWFVSMTVGAFAAAIGQVGTPRAAAGIVIDAVTNTVTLEPEKWVGSRCPLDGLTDIGSSLSAGDWLVVVFRHDCSHCQELLGLLQEHLALPAPLVLIEAPPFDEIRFERYVRRANGFGRLNDSYDWFIKSPVVILVRNGMVVRVASPLEEPLATSLEAFLESDGFSGQPSNLTVDSIHEG